MKRLIGSAIGLAMLAAACTAGHAASLGPAPSGSPVPSGSPSPLPHPSHSATPKASPSRPQTFTYRVWFELDGKLFEAKRTAPFQPAVGAIAMRSLLGGPARAERDSAVGSVIPPATRFRGLTIAGGIAAVDLSRDFGAGLARQTPPIVRLGLAQVVYTLTQYPTVQGVLFELDGSPATTIDGVSVQAPGTRAQYADVLPAILVESPVSGQRVANPVTVSGTADVFEGTVSVRILDASGREIARTFTQATCGTGCRGAFSVSVSYSVSVEQRGSVWVYETSAKDGSSLNLVAIEVTLTP